MVRALLLGSCAIAALAFTASSAAAAAAAVDNGALEEIIVTATKTGATNLQDTPLAITAFTADTLDRTGIKDVRDLITATPNLQITQNAAFAQVYIRGVGSNNVFAGSDPSSTIHLDGVYIARPAAYLNNFLDVERIEVLRGPQGTLYGRNSVGGTINVDSRRPDNTFRAKAQLTYGNYDFKRAEAYVSGPLIQDKLAASLSVIRSKRDGYLKNVVPGVGDVDNENVGGLRAQVRFTPSAPAELILRADYLTSDDALAGYLKLLQTTTDPFTNSTLGDYRKIAVNIRSNSVRRLKGLAGEFNYAFSDAVKFKSLTAYRTSYLKASNDTDATALNVRRTDQFEDQHQFSQEFNLTGKVDKFSYIAGYYFFDEHIDVSSSVITFPTVRANFSPIVDTRAQAGFGQATYAILPKVSLTAGARYTEERKKFNQTATNFALATNIPLAGFPRTYVTEGTYTAWTPKFGLEVRPSDDVMMYASVTRGFKSGGFNLSSTNPLQGFAPEKLWSYEAGAKLDFLANRLRVNTAIFHYDYTDLQVQSFLTPGVIDITNASDAKVDGVEIEAQARPVSGLQLGGNIAYLKAQYENYPNALKAGNIPFNATGHTLNLSPKWAYSAFAQYEFAVGKGSAFVRGEYSWRGRQFFTAENNALDTQKAYGLVNASVGYTFPGDHYQVLVYGRNLDDTQFITSTATFTGGVTGRVGEPRTYGVRLVANY